MITILDNTKEFLAISNNRPRYIYGAGNAGHWLAYYMDKCGYSYEGFIDIQFPEKEVIGRIKTTDGRHNRIHPHQLDNFEQVYIIIAANNPDGIISDLSWFAKKSNCICLVPVYKDFIHGTRVYDINRLLSYFRNKLVSKERIPTIISNDCSAGFVYHALGSLMLSPCINTSFTVSDFIKVARNPQRYLKAECVFSHYGTLDGRARTVGKIDDVYVLFGHADDGEEAIRKWNYLRSIINWDNLVFIFSDVPKQAVYSYCDMRDFCSIPYRHLAIISGGSYYFKNMDGIIYTREHLIFNRRDVAIENWFDLVGWINGDFEFGQVVESGG